jgi:hypothetical protein
MDQNSAILYRRAREEDFVDTEPAAFDGHIPLSECSEETQSLWAEHQIAACARCRYGCNPPLPSCTGGIGIKEILGFLFYPLARRA